MTGEFVPMDAGGEDATLQQPLGAPLRPVRDGASGLPHTEPMPALVVDAQFRRHASSSQRPVQHQALFRLCTWLIVIACMDQEHRPSPVRDSQIVGQDGRSRPCQDVARIGYHREVGPAARAIHIIDRLVRTLLE